MDSESCQENLKKTKGNFDVYMRKRFLTTCIAVFMLACGLGVFSACDTQSEQGPSLEYSLENGGYKVIGMGSYEDGEVVIPSTYKGKPVIAIGAEAFLREREIVHYQRFGEGLQLACDKLDSKNFYAFNPSFDKHCLKNCKNKMR